MSQGEWMGVATVLAFAAFIGVCVWAWSDRRKAQFEEAARLPFADEQQGGIGKGERNE